MANAADKTAVVTENLRDMGLDDESVAKCLQMVESGQYQALDEMPANGRKRTISGT